MDGAGVVGGLDHFFGHVLGQEGPHLGPEGLDIGSETEVEAAAVVAGGQGRCRGRGVDGAGAVGGSERRARDRAGGLVSPQEHG